MIVNYKNVSISLEDCPILEHINFEVNEREFIFLKGKVGTGKTTLLRSLYGMIPVEGDTAQVLGYDMLQLKRKKLPELRRQLGIIFQNFQLLPDRTVYANLEFILKATGWKQKEERDKRIKEVLELVALSDKIDQFPHRLSGGEQQRVAIARAILNNPKLIIADEPTGNLDYENSKNIVDILYSISQKGTAVIMTTHNIQLIPLIPSRVINFTGGSFTEVTGTPEEQNNE